MNCLINNKIKSIQVYLLYAELIFIIVFLVGCSAEKDISFPIETVGPIIRQPEKMAMDLDGKGIVNGLFHPKRLEEFYSDKYPIRYTGNWEIIQNNYRETWFIAMSSEKGAQVDVVGTMTRVIFDFYDPRYYSDSGIVSFWLDGQKLGEYKLARINNSNQAIMDYMVYTGKSSIATITMKIESGRVVIVGYRLIFH